MSTNRGTLVVYIAQTVSVSHHCKYIAICSIDAIVDNFNRFDLFCFFLRLTVCQDLNFAFLHRHENSYLLFHSRFSLILFLFLVFQLTMILFGVKAWYFYYGKCSLAAVAYAEFFNWGPGGFSKVTSKICSQSILWQINYSVQCNKMESKSHSA